MAQQRHSLAQLGSAGVRQRSAMSSYGRETQSQGKGKQRAARALGSPAVSSKGEAPSRRAKAKQ